MAEGIKYGYRVNPSKSCLIIKHPSSMERAMEIFGESGIEMKIIEQRQLGAVIGAQEYKRLYIYNLVEEWAKMINKLSDFDQSQPQAAYAAFTHSVRHKMTS